MQELQQHADELKEGITCHKKALSGKSLSESVQKNVEKLYHFCISCISDISGVLQLKSIINTIVKCIGSRCFGKYFEY